MKCEECEIKKKLYIIFFIVYIIYTWLKYFSGYEINFKVFKKNNKKIIFDCIVYFIFYRRLIIDYFLIQNIPVDIYLLALLNVITLSFIFQKLNSINLYQFIFTFIFGLSLSSLQRYCVGFCFHFNKVIEDWHESFHEELRKRKITNKYLLSDHISEIIAYTILFSIYYFISRNFNESIFYGLWIGILLEHYIGAEFRLHVQYVDISIWENSLFKRFYYNIEVYYWYHILIDTQMCFGFSSPFWDTIFKRNPFQSRFIFSSPIPFIDFLFVDYTKEYNEVKRALNEYKIEINK